MEQVQGSTVDSTTANQYEDSIPDAKITVYIPFEGEEASEKTVAFLRDHGADFMEAFVPPELHSTILARYHAAVWPVVDNDVMRFDGFRENSLKSLMAFYGWERKGETRDVPQTLVEEVEEVLASAPQRRNYVPPETLEQVDAVKTEEVSTEPYVNKAPDAPVPTETPKKASKASKG